MRLLFTSSVLLLLVLRLANAIDCSTASCVAKLGDKIFPCSSTFLGMKMGYGTLGGFFETAVRPEDEKTYYAITNAHVIAEGETSHADHAGKYIDTEICTDDGFILGKVKAYHTKYDAAFIEIAPHVRTHITATQTQRTHHNKT